MTYIRLLATAEPTSKPSHYMNKAPKVWSTNPLCLGHTGVKNLPKEILDTLESANSRVEPPSATVTSETANSEESKK